MLSTKIKFLNIVLLAATLALASLLGLRYYLSRTESVVSSAMIGTWFFDNPLGDDEQMAIFDDGSVVVLYSNGHRDETHYEDGYITLAEYDNIRLKMTVVEGENLMQYSDADKSAGFAKRWRRIDPEPRTDLLRALTGNRS